MSSLTAQADALLSEASLAWGQGTPRALQLSMNHISAFLSRDGEALDRESPERVTALGQWIDQMAYTLKQMPDPREKNPFSEASKAFSESIRQDIAALGGDAKRTLFLAAIVVLGVLILSRQV